MRKFIFFDLDNTLIFENKELSEKTKNFLKNLDIEYGICTQRPMLGIPSLSYLNNAKYYVCEGGIVAYDADKKEMIVDQNIKSINHELIKESAIKFLHQRKIDVELHQNTKRVYSSTLYFDGILDKDVIMSLCESIINLLGDRYEFIVLNKNKVIFTIKSVIKADMIKEIMEDNIHYYLISDDEQISEKQEVANISYISVNPSNLNFNNICEFVARGDFDTRLIDAILYVKDKSV